MRQSRIIFCTTVFLAVTSASLLGMDGSKVSPSLAQKQLGAGDWVNVVALLQNSKANSPKMTPGLVREARLESSHAALVSELQRQDAENTNFVNRLRELEAQGLVTNIQTYWITSAASFSVDASVLDELSQSGDLKLLLEDQPLELIDPVSEVSTSSGFAGSSSYISLIGVRDLWNLGYTGHGRLVCSFDTGVEGTHPALSANWKGSLGTESESWFDPYGSTSPVDLSGHGTHTMGLMVGREGADTIGVAFNAQWISASVIDRGQSLNKTVSDILAAFEWAADPDGNPQTVSDLPDVICNSWGIPRGLMAPCDQTFWEAIDNLEALGVVVIFACGNEGPNAGTIRNPADRAASVNSFSIGAVDQTRSDLPVASFSSRGPASCDESKIKPELVAPGVGLRSSYKNGGYRQMSGTSMAAPVVAGCIALMREYNPNATVAEIKDALVRSVTDLGPVGQDNDYGYGFINVKKAIQFLPAPIKPRIQISEVKLGDDAQTILAIGNTTGLNLTVSNVSVFANGLRAVIRSNNPHVFVLNPESEFGNVASDALAANDSNPFQIKIDHSAVAGEEALFTVDFFGQQHGYLNSADFSLILGQPAIADIATLSTQRLSFEVSNFGLSRRLFDTALGEDPLDAMSLVIAADNGNVYDEIADKNGFRAKAALRSNQTGSTSQVTSEFSTMDDAFQVECKSIVLDDPIKRNFILTEYTITSQSTLASLAAVALGFDFDFDGGEAVLREGDDFFFRSNNYDHYIGVRVIPTGNTFGTAVDGQSFKDGAITDPAKHWLLTSGESSENLTISDNALFYGVTGLSAGSSQSVTFAFVIASGNSIDEIHVALQAGQGAYNQTTDTDDDEDVVLPRGFELQQNFPNPFNAETRIDFSLPVSGDYSLEIFNSLGQLVNTIDVVAASAGTQHVVWNGKNSGNLDVATGVYFYRLEFGGNSITKKMVLLK